MPIDEKDDMLFLEKNKIIQTCFGYLTSIYLWCFNDVLILKVLRICLTDINCRIAYVFFLNTKNVSASEQEASNNVTTMCGCHFKCNRIDFIDGCKHVSKWRHRSTNSNKIKSIVRFQWPQAMHGLSANCFNETTCLH